MPLLNQKAFVEEILKVRHYYINDNEWVGRWGAPDRTSAIDTTQSWHNHDVMVNYITAAYRLYSATATNRLQFTMLGGTEIRMNEELVRNFGVTGTNGIQEHETESIVFKEEIARERRGRAGAIAAWQTEQYATLDSSIRGRPTPVLGGAILSEQNWTPILNDALILGAIEARQEFYLAFTPNEQALWERLNGDKVNKSRARGKVARLRDKFDTNLTDAWKTFFIEANKAPYNTIYNNRGPRVFARELLGLAFFGYEPEFSWHQVGFFPTKDGGERPSFSRYLQCLRGVGFQATGWDRNTKSFNNPSNKTAIMKTISKFLFNDVNAIR